jgi:glycosyltransferase involved in cell wall biosynthesis
MTDETSTREDTAALPTGRAAPLRILILNWRDIRHPAAGGAERVTFEMARRWREWGHEVIWFAASYPGAAKRETIDGIDVWREGSQATVHWQAFRHYRRFFRGRFDVIVDEVNTIPFFTPLYARAPVVLLLHQLARKVWFYEAPWLLAALGYVAEPLYLQPYRRVPVLTVSESTKRDSERLGLRAPVTILPLGIDLPRSDRLPDLDQKERRWTVIYVGRVVPSKRVPHLIEALRRLRDKHGQQAQLWIVGAVSDDYQATLHAQVIREGLAGDVVFWGQVPLETKRDLLQRAHVLAMTSVREGWGLTVGEAAGVGTPSVVYDVPGLRDSTIHEQTGMICPDNSPEALARAMARMKADPKLYGRLRESAWGRTAPMYWERTAVVGQLALTDAIQRHEGRKHRARQIARRDWTYPVAVVLALAVLLLSHNYALAIAAGLLVACVMGRISALTVMVTGLVFVGVAAGLALLDQLGWINESPRLTLIAAALGLADLRSAENGAGVNAFELFAVGTAGLLTQAIRAPQRGDK